MEKDDLEKNAALTAAITLTLQDGRVIRFQNSVNLVWLRANERSLPEAVPRAVFSGIDVTEFEGKILQCLMSRADQFVSAADLNACLYSETDTPTKANVVEVLIYRLRKHLPGVIETKRFRGYRIAIRPPESSNVFELYVSAELTVRLHGCSYWSPALSPYAQKKINVRYDDAKQVADAYALDGAYIAELECVVSQGVQ